MKAVRLVILAGALIFGTGLLLLLTPLLIIAIIVALPLGALMTLGGLYATNISPSGLGLLGGIVVLLGFGWTAYDAWVLNPISCGPSGGCPLAIPLIDDPMFWAGVSIITMGAAIVCIAALKWRNARKAHSIRAQPARAPL
jgi:hypothetical protein